MTLELDAETAGCAKHLADTWRISVEEAVKRAVKGTDAAVSQYPNQTRLEAFRALQRSLNLDDAKANAWIAMIRDARR